MGYGRLIKADGSIYEGINFNLQSNDKGTYTMLNGNNLKKNLGYKYQGQWLSGKKNGEGNEEFPDGTKIKGNYVNGN